MDVRSSFPEKIIQDLANSGISIEEAQRVGWSVISHPTRKQIKELLNFSPTDVRALISILVIPYLSETGQLSFNRLKLFPPLTIRVGDKEETVKYLQPKGTPTQPYVIPKLWEIKNKPNVPLIITEGEKKTLCLHLNGFNAVGLPGVWNFRDGNNDLMEALKEWKWKGRDVRIAFDSDFLFNRFVRLACIELALRLWERGAIVRIVQLPQPDHRKKMGVDDYIIERDVESFREIYQKALPIAKAFSSTYFEEVLGNSFVYFRGAWGERQALSIPSDFNVIDELDRSKPDIVEMYEERLSASELGWELYVSTPTIPKYGISELFEETDRREWFVKCRCKEEQILTEENIMDGDFRCLKCRKVLNRAKGKWKATRDSDIVGYWGHL